MKRSAEQVGAYGLAVDGMDGASGLMSVPDEWPRVRIEHRVGTRDELVTSNGADVVRINLIDDGLLVADRRQACATFVTRTPLGLDDLAHPYLAAAAAPFAGWLGRAALHAGAFLDGHGAWGVLGAKEDGKSTLLASLALAGIPVLTDDALVVEQGRAFAGPRCIDLRREAAVALDVIDRALPARSGERARFPLAPEIPLVVPLRGWFTLAWGDEPGVRRLSASERLIAVASRAGGSAPLQPEELLDLAALTAWELRRPRRLDLLDDAVQLIASVASL